MGPNTTKWLSLLLVLMALGACASDPVYTVPVDQTVADYIVAIQLDEVAHIRKDNSDGWQYLNDRYAIYRGKKDYLVEFRSS